MGKACIALFIILILSVIPPTVFAASKEAGQAAKLASGAGAIRETRKDKRVRIIREYLESLDSPLAPYANTFVEQADKFNLDWRLVVSIAGIESTFGKRVPKNSFNAWGWGMPTASSDGIRFIDWNEGIITVSKGLKEKYIDRGLTTIEQIGKQYAASPTWAQRVRFFMNQIESYKSTPEIDTLGLTL
jgi:hypothetical protein